MASTYTDGGIATVFGAGVGPGTATSSGSSVVSAVTLEVSKLFARIGHVIGGLNEYNAFRGTTAPDRVLTLLGDYTASDEAIIDGIQAQLTSLQSSGRGYASYLQTLAANITTTTVNGWKKQPDSSLATALNYLIGLMQMGSVTVQSSVIGSTASSGSSNIGNANVVVSTKLKSGMVAEDAYPEVLSGVVTSDANTGGSASGRETVTFKGQQAVTDTLSWSWPGGSGATTAVQSVSALQNNSSGRGNWLSNGSMETWTVANVPDGWHYGAGLAGVQFLESTSNFYDGSSSLQIVGDGSTRSSVYQRIGVDTTVSMVPNDQVAVNFALKTDGPPADGVLTVELVDGSGSVIRDGQGIANSLAIDLTVIDGIWVINSASFRTPTLLPSSVSLRFRLSTPLSNGVNLWLDHVALSEGFQLYAMGPTVWVFSGSTNLIAGDTFSVTFSSVPGGFQSGFDRLFNMKSIGYLLPSSASPTISGSLIV